MSVLAGLIASHCLDGELLYQKHHLQSTAGSTVQTNFKGVQVFASPFFNADILDSLLRGHLHGKTKLIVFKRSTFPKRSRHAKASYLENSRDVTTSLYKPAVW